jgi:hypothetical protein
MAAPNVVNVATITGKTFQLKPSSTSEEILLANSSGSNKVIKVNVISVANINGASAIDATVSINSAANGSGTSLELASTITVPADATVVVVDKNSGFYLEEDKSIVVTTGVGSNLVFTTSYEELS